MESRRERPRVMGWLGIVAVLSNLLTGLLCMTPVKAVVPVDDLVGPLVLCTEHGPQAVPGSDMPGGTGGVPPDGKSSHCTACTLLAGMALLVALVLAAIAFPVRVVLPFKSAARTLADHLSLGGIRSRAPPLPA
jgi:DUF2946 family protein